MIFLEYPVQLYLTHSSQYFHFFKEEFYSDKNYTKKYSVGIIDMIKLRIYITHIHTYLYTYS